MTPAQTICAWLASLVFGVCPPTRVKPNDEFAQQEYREHVYDVVNDIYIAVYENKSHSWFSGKWARAYEAALVTIIGSEEGKCFDPILETRPTISPTDHSFCYMQLNIGHGKTIDGRTGSDLLASRISCFLSGLTAARRSLNSCRRYGVLSGLSVYDTGKCIENESISVSRMTRVFYSVTKKVPTDDEVTEYLRASYMSPSI
jgi:hypothetical protein